MRRHTAAPGEHAGKALTAHSHSRRDLSDGFIASGANGRAETSQRLILSVFADHRNEVVPSNMIRFAPLALDFLHHRADRISPRRDIGVKADHAGRLRDRTMWNAGGNERALASGKIDDFAVNEKPPPTGKHECDLVLVVEMRRKAHLAAVQSPQFYDALRHRTPVGPFAAGCGWHITVEETTLHIV